MIKWIHIDVVINKTKKKPFQKLKNCKHTITICIRSIYTYIHYNNSGNTKWMCYICLTQIRTKNKAKHLLIILFKQLFHLDINKN